MLRLCGCVPEITQAAAAAASSTAHLRWSHLSVLSTRGHVRGGRLRSLGVGGQPLREGPAFLRVVCAEHARDVRVVLGVAVSLVGEELPPERVVT